MRARGTLAAALVMGLALASCYPVYAPPVRGTVADSPGRLREGELCFDVARC